MVVIIKGLLSIKLQTFFQELKKGETNVSPFSIN